MKRIIARLTMGQIVVVLTFAWCAAMLMVDWLKAVVM